MFFPGPVSFSIFAIQPLSSKIFPLILLLLAAYGYIEYTDIEWTNRD